MYLYYCFCFSGEPRLLQYLTISASLLCPLPKIPTNQIPNLLNFPSFLPFPFLFYV